MVVYFLPLFFLFPHAQLSSGLFSFSPFSPQDAGDWTPLFPFPPAVLRFPERFQNHEVSVPPPFSSIIVLFLKANGLFLFFPFPGLQAPARLYGHPRSFFLGDQVPLPSSRAGDFFSPFLRSLILPQSGRRYGFFFALRVGRTPFLFFTSREDLAFADKRASSIAHPAPSPGTPINEGIFFLLVGSPFSPH